MPIKNVVVVAICAIVSLTCHFAATRNRYANLFAEVVELVNQKHLLAPDRRDLFDSAIDGMLTKLDRNSSFLAGRESTTFDELMQQEFGGVGIYVEIDPESKYLMISVPMPDTPAFRAGLRSRDLILAIEGVSTFGRDRSEATSEMRGPIGEPITLEMQRDGQDFTVTLERAKIPVTSVFGETTNPDGSRNFTLEDDPRIGYLRIDQFGNRTTEETRTALRQIAGRIHGLVIDLRNNGGGPLDSAVDIADMFLPGGLTIVETRGRDRKLEEARISTEGTELPAGTPIAVLVNRNSASASEVVAACLQDHARAVVVGERTYGKGTVQNVYDLEPQRSKIRLTTASYWPPSGRCIDRYDPSSVASGIWGVQPNPGFEFETTDEEIVALKIQIQSREIAGLLGPPSVPEKTGNEGEDENGLPNPAGTDAPAAAGHAAEPGVGSDLPTAGREPQLEIPDLPLERAREWIRQRRGQSGDPSGPRTPSPP